MDCFLCKKADQPVCDTCNLIGVCEEHKHLHSFEQECLPYRVVWKENRGNTLVALRDIKPFQIIFQDSPVVLAPFDDNDIQCFECSKPMETWNPCPVCSLPVCDQECSIGPNHSAECEYFADSNLYSKGVPLNIIQTSISPIRMLEVKRKNPTLWKLVDSLEDHLEKRKKEKFWTYIKDTVFPFIKEHSTKDIDTNLASRIIGIYKTNSVKWEKRFGDKKYTVGHALCPIFSLLCHSCVNNTRYTVSEDHITVRACVPIKAGEEITSQYRGPHEGNILRRLDFPKIWKFECDCVRCMDPTELGTHSSTLVCPQCKKPDLYPRNSTMRSDFECRSCAFEMSYDIALEDTNRADKKLKNKTLLDSVESWEALLVELETQFHPNHFLCMKTIKTLIQLYGLRKGYTLTDLSEELINRKLELCRRFMDVYNIIEPGYRLWKGRLCEDMLGPMSLQLQSKFENKQIGKLEFMLGYRNIIKTVKEAAKCRQFMERNEEDDKMMGEYYKKWIEPLTNV